MRFAAKDLEYNKKAKCRVCSVSSGAGTGAGSPSRDIRGTPNLILLGIFDASSRVERHWRAYMHTQTMKLVIPPTFVSACQAIQWRIAIDQAMYVRLHLS